MSLTFEEAVPFQVFVQYDGSNGEDIVTETGADANGWSVDTESGGSVTFVNANDNTAIFTAHTGDYIAVSNGWLGGGPIPAADFPNAYKKISEL